MEGLIGLMWGEDQRLCMILMWGVWAAWIRARYAPIQPYLVPSRRILLHLTGLLNVQKMDVLDAVVLAHLESRRLPPTIPSPQRGAGGQPAEQRQTALHATLVVLETHS